MKGKYEQKKVGLESHSDVYRVRRRPAYSSVTPFLILAKQGAAAPLDIKRNIIKLVRFIDAFYMHWSVESS